MKLLWELCNSTLKNIWDGRKWTVALANSALAPERAGAVAAAIIAHDLDQELAALEKKVTMTAVETKLYDWYHIEYRGNYRQDLQDWSNTHTMIADTPTDDNQPLWMQEGIKVPAYWIGEYHSWEQTLEHHPHRPNYKEVCAYNWQYCQRAKASESYPEHAGGISVNVEGVPSYTVCNYHSNQIHTNLTRDQVSQALADLDIVDDGRWSWRGPHISSL